MRYASRRVVVVGLCACCLLALVFVARHATASTSGRTLGFAPERSVPVSPGPAAIAVGDLNRDGIADLVVAGSSRAVVTVRLGKGNGGFGPPHGFRVASGTMSLAAADLNGDGRPDLITTATASSGKPVSVCVLFGKGDGTFDAPHVYVFARDVGAYRRAPLAIRDLNGDHRPDVVTSWGMNLFVVLAKRDGSLGPAHAFPVDVHDVDGDGGVTALAVGDLNGDRRADVVAGATEGVNTPNGVVSALLGKGAGAFKAAVARDARQLLPTGLALSDLDHDGKLDLVAGYAVDAEDYGAGGSDYAAVVVSRGKGNGRFAQTAQYDLRTEQSIGGPVIADFDGDGERDVALAVGRGIDVLLGNGDGTLRAGAELGQERWPYGEMLAAGDFNPDRKPDLVATSSARTARAVAVFVNRSR